MTLATALGIEWTSGHIRRAALGVATFASARLKVLRAEPAIYLHWPRVFGYIAAPIACWVLLVWGLTSAWKAVF